MADIVKFKLPDGTEVSNDPRFYQRDLQKQLDEQAKALLAIREPKGKETRSAGEQTDEGLEQAEDESEVTDSYDSDNVKTLKAEAERRELDLSGITKKSELIALLRTDDAQRATEDEDDEESDDEE